MSQGARAYLPLVPFVGLLFILPFPGTVALRLVFLAAAFAVALLSWRKLALPSIPGKPALLVWIALSVGSLGYAVDVSYSLGEIKNEIGYAMMAFVAFFAITRDAPTLQLWGRVFIVATAGIGLWALVVYFGIGRWDIGGGHTGVGAYASLAVVVPSALLIAFAREDRLRWVGWTAASIILVAVVASEQRIVWIAYGAQCVAAALLVRKAGLAAYSRRAVAVFVTACLVIALAAVLAVHALKVSQSSPELQSLGADHRPQHWRRVFERIQEHPMLGAGFGREAMKRAYPDLVPQAGPEALLWHPHNVFLTYGIAMGWPGMLVLLGLFLSLCREYWRHLHRPQAFSRLAAIAGIMLIIGVVTRNMTNDFFLRDGALMFWALNGALLGFLSRRDSDQAGGH